MLIAFCRAQTRPLTLAVLYPVSRKAKTNPTLRDNPVTAFAESDAGVKPANVRGASV
jgi:hypothetical protein